MLLNCYSTFATCNSQSESKCDPSETDSHVPDPKDRDHARRKHGINHHPSNGKDLVYQAYNGQEWRNGVQVQGGLEADG